MPVERELWGWLEHAIAVVGLLMALYKVNKGNQEKLQTRHEENIQRLANIEGTLTPIAKWFEFNVINKRD